jgi:hypothetical protein
LFTSERVQDQVTLGNGYYLQEDLFNKKVLEFMEEHGLTDRIITEYRIGKPLIYKDYMNNVISSEKVNPILSSSEHNLGCSRCSGENCVVHLMSGK